MEKFTILKESPEQFDKSNLVTSGTPPPAEYSSKEITLLTKTNAYKLEHLKESGIKKVLLNFLKFNIGPLKNKIIQKINNLDNFAKNFKEKYKEIDIHDHRVNQIKNYFKNNDINLIYEFGSGASSYLFCYLLKKQYEEKGIKGKVISFDQSKTYQNIFAQDFPMEYEEFIEFRYCDLKMTYQKDVRFLGYDIIYDDQVDLAYFDGPTPKLLPNNFSSQAFAHLNLLEMLEIGNLEIGFTDKRQFYVLGLEDFDFSSYDINYFSHLRSFELRKKKA